MSCVFVMSYNHASFDCSVTFQAMSGCFCSVNKIVDVRAHELAEMQIYFYIFNFIAFKKSIVIHVYLGYSDKNGVITLRTCTCNFGHDKCDIVPPKT